MVGTPLGDIAGHVKEAVAIGGEGGHGRGEGKAVVGEIAGVVIGPVTPPGIGEVRPQG